MVHLMGSFGMKLLKMGHMWFSIQIKGFLLQILRVKAIICQVVRQFLVQKWTHFLLYSKDHGSKF